MLRQLLALLTSRFNFTAFCLATLFFSFLSFCSLKRYTLIWQTWLAESWRGAQQLLLITIKLLGFITAHLELLSTKECKKKKKLTAAVKKAARLAGKSMWIGLFFFFLAIVAVFVTLKFPHCAKWCNCDFQKSEENFPAMKILHQKVLCLVPLVRNSIFLWCHKGD